MQSDFFGSLFKSETIKQRLAFCGGRTRGFDYMRLTLATLVIFWHSQELGLGAHLFYKTHVFRIGEPLFHLIVPMFFALSGFLVAGSLERCRTLVSFIGLRAFRILPALSVEVILSVLILGPLCTTLSLEKYFAHPEFRRYFLNIVGDIHYTLPGVFLLNPFQTVNAQLWTIPYELKCYAILSGLALVGLFRNSALLVILGLLYLVQVELAITHVQASVYDGPKGIWAVMAFVSGLLMFRSNVLLSKPLFIVALVTAVALCFVRHGADVNALPLAYATVYLGLLNPRPNRVLFSGDYSYGLYLYGTPIQQGLIVLSPLFRHWYANFTAAMVLSTAIAVLSWRWIEKPVLARREILTRMEIAWIAAFPAFYRAKGTIA